MICLAILEPVIRINQKDVRLHYDVYVAWHGRVPQFDRIGKVDQARYRIQSQVLNVQSPQ